jgi:hypothetical protein
MSPLAQWLTCLRYTQEVEGLRLADDDFSEQIQTLTAKIRLCILHFDSVID